MRGPLRPGTPSTTTLLSVATLAVTLLGVGLLAGSWRHLSATWDESNHLGSGLEWWQHGEYTWWTENPPLPRAAIAAFPYLHGMRLPDRAAWDPRTQPWLRAWTQGTSLLHAGDGYETNLRRMRMGVLPFFVLSVLAVWLLAGARRRPLEGFIAAALVATLPSMIGNGAVAATDVPFVAMFLLAALALVRWLETPDRGRAALAGAAAAGAVLAKFSALAYLPLFLGACLIARGLCGRGVRPRQAGPGSAFLTPLQLVGQLGLAAGAGALVVWAGYRFDVGRIDALPVEAVGWFRYIPPPSQQSALFRWVAALPLPAPAFFHGLIFFKEHNAIGHGSAYLFGEISRLGFRSFFPVALAVKTPLPFLSLVAVAAVLLVRRARRRDGSAWIEIAAGMAACAILAVSIAGKVNIGSRHVLVVLPLLAVAVARALGSAFLSAQGRARTLVGAAIFGALISLATIAVRAHPNNLSYFNPLARDPAAILLSSDRDWGQGLLQLRREAQARGIPSLKLAFFGVDNPCRIGLPPIEPLVPGRPSSGWIAISENYYRERGTSRLIPDPCEPESQYPSGAIPPHPFAWLRAHQPVAIVADSIRLYYISPAEGPR